MEIQYKYEIGEKVRTIKPFGYGEVSLRRPANDNALYAVYEIEWRETEKSQRVMLMNFDEFCIAKLTDKPEKGKYAMLYPTIRRMLLEGYTMGMIRKETTLDVQALDGILRRYLKAERKEWQKIELKDKKGIAHYCGSKWNTCPHCSKKITWVRDVCPHCKGRTR